MEVGMSVVLVVSPVRVACSVAPLFHLNLLIQPAYLDTHPTPLPTLPPSLPTLETPAEKVRPKKPISMVKAMDITRPALLPR